MPRHRKSRKSMKQRGGFLDGLFGSSDPNAPKKDSWWSSASSSMPSMSTMPSMPSFSSSSTAPAPAPPAAVPPAVSGGRRRRHMRGGKGGLGLTYYASPVEGSNVAEPTYWIRGGTRRRKSRKSRRTRRHRRH
jgi:hypothetical protein